MVKMKRIIVSKLFSTVAVMLTLVLMFGQVVNAKYFSDISTYSREYKDSISFVADNGYMNGTYTNLFSPSETMTRAMFVTVLYNMAGKPTVNNSIPFPDVPSNAWYYNSVRWAYAIGLVSGSGTGYFSPNTAIARQDACLILYRYANYNGCSVSKQASLTNYSDYANVASYALTAVQWAVAVNIYPNMNAPALLPSASFDRAEMALMIKRFGTNVEFVKFGRDSYSFTNSNYYFTSNDYFIYGSHLDYLANCIYAAYTDQALAYQEICQLNSYREQVHNDGEWPGSCYGMALTTILDKLGKLDFNKNFASSANMMYDVSMQAGSITESAINYYQFSQFASKLKHGMVNYTNKTIGQQMSQVVSDMEDNKGLGLFCYRWMNGTVYVGHAIVVYDLTQTYPGIYQLTEYDNNKSTSPSTIIMDLNNNFCAVQQPDGSFLFTTDIDLQTDFDGYDAIDLDDDLNVGNNMTISSCNADYETLYVEMNCLFEIQNASNQFLIWDGNRLQGNMNVIDSDYIINGPDYPCILKIIVQKSDMISIESTTEGEDIRATFVNESGAFSARNTKAKKVLRDNNNHIHVVDQRCEE